MQEVKPGFRLALVATIFAGVVILLGAWTRLVDAGLGCPDWPGCYGQWVVPESAAAIKQAESLYPNAPVESFKAWAEMTHRYAAGMLGLLVLALAIITWLARKKDWDYPVLLISILVVLIILQGAAGALTVTWKLWPQVVTLHLLGGFLTIGLLALVTCRLSGAFNIYPMVAPARLPQAQKMVSAGLLLLLVQIILGGWTSSNYAAMACPDLPTCQGQWLPKTDFSKGFDLTQATGANYLGGQLESAGRTAIHLAHRMGAVVVATYLFTTMLILLLWGLPKKWGLGILAILSMQMTLGFANILLSLPIGIATAHNGMAALLFILMLILYDHMSRLMLWRGSFD